MNCSIMLTTPCTYYAESNSVGWRDTLVASLLCRAHPDVAIPERIDWPRFGGHGAFAKLATLPLLLRIVEHQIERIEIAESTAHIQSRQFAIHYQGHTLLAYTAM